MVAEQLQRLAGDRVVGRRRGARMTRDGLGLADPDALSGRRGRPGRAAGAPVARGHPAARRRVSDRRIRRTPEVVGRTLAAGRRDRGRGDVDRRVGDRRPAVPARYGERAAGREYAARRRRLLAGPPGRRRHPGRRGARRDWSREPGERAFDLYCGVGLFAGALADAGCQVWGVEASRRAIHHARRNLADAGRATRFTAGRVEQVLRQLPDRTDLVVLDPPRSGAGRGHR